MLIETLRQSLVCFEGGLPETPEQATPDHINPWRDRIDQIDTVLLQLLNERSRCANAIGHIKKQLNMPIYVPRREEEVLNHVLTTNQGPLPNDAVRRLFERIIDETRSLERRKYQGEPEE